MTLLAILIGTVVFGYVIQVLALWLSARICKVPDIRVGRAALAALALGLLGVTVVVGQEVLSQRVGMLGLPWIALAVAIVVAIPCISWLFRTSGKKAFLVWLLMTAMGWAVMLPVAMGVRAKVMEAFVVPTGGMAPTILGKRWACTCPKCSTQFEATYVPPSDYGFAPQMATCPKCDATFQPQGRPLPGDRVLADKLARPKRWDIVVFHNPMNESQTFVQRLVGMPGETIEIADGEVLINGRPEPKPAGLDIHYLASPDPARFPPAKLVTLGPNEYYVLGDNTKGSFDSRLWGTRGKARQGAIPGDLFIGVVHLTYWPVGRWRMF